MTTAPDSDSPRAVTFDCWGTLIIEPNSAGAIALRVEALSSAAAAEGGCFEADAVRAALDVAWKRHIALWQEGVAKLGATKAGFFLYLEPLSTTALAVPYLGESFGPFTLIGGLLVLAGVWYGQRRKTVS